MNNHSHITNILILTLFALSACTDHTKDQTKTSKNDPLIPPGLSVYDFQPMQSNCISCHKVFSGNGRADIAPSMAEIRSAYLAEFSEKDEFTQAIVAFSKNPRAEDALMREAVAKYGLMPKLGVNDAELNKIAAYLYHYEVGTQDWQEKLKDHTDVQDSEEGLGYVERGRKYATGTKQALGSKLLAAIGESGPAGAVEFCNIQALPITDSMSTNYGARIKRVSDRPRNPANRANAEELAYIEALKTAKRLGEDLDPLITEKGETVWAYFAIETNDMCLKCHGQKDKDISSETWTVIADRYPNDQATGYGVNEIRGIFVVEMND